MNQSSVILDREPLDGDCWQGAELNHLIPLLERNGFAIVPGSVDERGFEVGYRGQTLAVDLVRPGEVRVRRIDRDDAPSDQYPVVAGSWPAWSFYGRHAS